MPTYEFTCQKCGDIFDEILPASRANDPIPCPSCGAKKTQRNVTGFAGLGGSKEPSSSRSSSSSKSCGACTTRRG